MKRAEDMKGWEDAVSGMAQNEWDWFKKELVGQAETEADRDALCKELVFGPHRRRSLRKWLEKFEQLEDALGECPQLVEFLTSWTKRSVDWERVGRWQAGKNPPGRGPEWFRKWLPMVVIRKKERQSRMWGNGSFAQFLREVYPEQELMNSLESESAIVRWLKRG